MTAAPQATPSCVVCGTVVTPEMARCPTCGLTRPAARGSSVLGRHGLWALGALLLALYIGVLLVVAAAR
jgi:hypothetical protein